MLLRTASRRVHRTPIASWLSGHLQQQRADLSSTPLDERQLQLEEKKLAEAAVAALSLVMDELTLGGPGRSGRCTRRILASNLHCIRQFTRAARRPQRPRPSQATQLVHTAGHPPLAM